MALVGAVTQAQPTAFVEADRVMYRRTETDSEIDLAGPELEIPFECNCADASWRREAETMRVGYCKGVIATRSPLAMGHDEPVWAVPAGIPAWLPDT